MQYYAREVPKATLGLYDEIEDDDSDYTKQTRNNLTILSETI
jgi:hypothetical protein